MLLWLRLCLCITIESSMHWAAGILSVSVILIILIDAFETVILPRRVNRKVRLARFFYLATWTPWKALARRMSNNKKRENFLSFYGPLSLLILFAIWALCLVHSFAALQWAVGSHLKNADGQQADIFTVLYMSGTTFFTLGLGDVTPNTQISRFLTVMEAGVGFAMLAAVIGYLPTIYQAFSRREGVISMLDARAGSPPSAYELIRRHTEDGALEALNQLFAEWERLAAEIMESHISYPVLCYFRSQHDNQSWIAALTAVLDACALVMSGIEGIPDRQARLTFAMARHAMVDLAQIFGRAPVPGACPRLSDEDRQRIASMLAENGVRMNSDHKRLDELRLTYEGYVVSLAAFLAMEVPPWIKKPNAKDNWTTSAWTVQH